MIAQMFIYLLVCGGIAVSYHRIRLQKFFSGILFLLLMLSGYLFYWVWQHQIFNRYSYAWLTSTTYPINFDLFSQPENYIAILPFLGITLLGILYTIFDRIEKHQFFLSGLFLLNLAALIMTICSHNTLQILLGLCFIDVIGFCAINNIQARRRYIFYNLLADMGIFMAFAMFWGDCHTNLLPDLLKCGIRNSHNLTLGIIIAVSCLKAGLFPFQGYIMPFAVLSESRRNLLSYLSTPVAGFLLLYHFQPMINATFPGKHWINLIALFSIAWGILGGVFIKHLTDKKLYLNLLLYGLSFGIIAENNGIWFKHLAVLWILHFVISNSLAYTQKYVWQMIMVTLLGIMAVTLETGNLTPNLLINIYLIGLVVILSCQTEQTHTQGREESSCLKLSLAGISAAAVIVMYGAIPWQKFYWLIGFLLLLLLKPHRWLQKVYAAEDIQNADICSKILYLLFAGPVHFLGRVLWLTIDFLIIERTILSSLDNLNNWFARIFDRLHRPTIKNALIFLSLSLIIIYYSIEGEFKLWK